MLTKGMATGWGKHGLRANALAPGYFRTELNKALVEDEKFAARTPLGRWGVSSTLMTAHQMRGSLVQASRRAPLPRQSIPGLS
jgi:NAD(P)-dependent dehydrogenase (short-subunit alcohol dehydrogenase family)